MTSSQSIEVLNDAYDFQRRLDWVLFSNENEHHDSDSNWVPGDPLWPHPRVVNGELLGNCIRPMFELFEDEEDDTTYSWKVVRCSDCDVDWSGDEPCFSCGKDYPQAKYDMSHLITYTRADVELARQMQEVFVRMVPRFDPFIEAMRNTSEALRGFSSHLYVWDEASTWTAWDIETYELPGSAEFQGVWDLANPRLGFCNRVKAKLNPFVVPKLPAGKLFYTQLEEMRDWWDRVPNARVWVPIDWRSLSVREIQPPTGRYWKVVIPPERVNYPVTSIARMHRRRNL